MKKEHLERLLSLPDEGKELVAAVVALVRASLENGCKTENTEAALSEALKALLDGDVCNIEKNLDSVRAEKNILAPDCAVCMNPCARTAEYPVSELLSEGEELACMKAEFIFETAARNGEDLGFDDTCNRIFMFGYEKDAERFAEFVEKLNRS